MDEVGMRFFDSSGTGHIERNGTVAAAEVLRHYASDQGKAEEEAPVASTLQYCTPIIGEASPD